MNAMGVRLPPYSTAMQSYNFRSIVLPDISFDEKTLLTIARPPTHPPTQLAQFDTAEEFDYVTQLLSYVRARTAIATMSAICM